MKLQIFLHIFPSCFFRFHITRQSSRKVRRGWNVERKEISGKWTKGVNYLCFYCYHLLRWCLQLLSIQSVLASCVSLHPSSLHPTTQSILAVRSCWAPAWMHLFSIPFVSQQNEKDNSSSIATNAMNSNGSFNEKL